MNIGEQVRSRMLRHMFTLGTVAADWNLRRERVLGAFQNPNHPSAAELVNLGNSLAAMFQVTGTENRSQSALAGGGSVWEFLVLWYLNLCYAGTHAVAVTKRFVLPCVRDALSVNYDNRSVKSDMDIVVLACSGLAETPSEILPEKTLLARADALFGAAFAKNGVINVQAKTHWNDSAQVPMLWNVIYRQARLRQIVENGFGVGRGIWSIANLGDFGYAFVCAPSNRAALNYGPHQVPVLRVRGMTAGAFWGHPTRNGVAASMAEFFMRQFQRRGNVWPNVADLGRGYATAAAGSAATSFRDVAAFHLHGSET